MSEDKRKVHTDALETLGMIIDETAKRDAIHLAVEPVVAKERLYPGDHVSVDGRKCRPYEGDAVGIVDPFLAVESVLVAKTPNGLRDSGLRPGERFWLVLYPRQITSLRHVWEHPAFPPSEIQVKQEVDSEIEKSRKWIQDFADSVKLHYDVLMQGAHDWVYSLEDGRCWAYGDFLILGSHLEGKSVPPEFWTHYEIVTGKEIKDDIKRNFFSCYC